MERTFDINEKGCSIRCRLFCSDRRNIRRLVLFGHGFGGSKDARSLDRFAEHMIKKEASAALLAFDWPCHGKDVRKRLTLEDCDTYLSLMLGYCSGTWPSAELYGFAVSFGAYLFLKYIHEHGDPFRRTVLRSPAVSMYDTLVRSVLTPSDLERLSKGHEVYAGFDRRIPVSPYFANELREADVRSFDYLDHADDLLILHGTRDELIPFADVKAFSEKNVIELIPMEGADHRFQDPQKMDAAIYASLRFFEMIR